MITFFIPARVAFDPSGANVRQLGSYQSDALQKITGSAEIRSMSPHFAISNFTGVFYTRTASNQQIGASSNGQLQGAIDLIIDSSRVARSSSETRGMNTAFHLRLVAY